MKRRAWPLLLFGLCLAVAMGSMALATRAVLGLEQKELRARERAMLEENVRLALWRMETEIAPLIASENARPPEGYLRPEAKDPDAPNYVHARFELGPGGNIEVAGGPADLHKDKAPGQGDNARAETGLGGAGPLIDAEALERAFDQSSDILAARLDLAENNESVSETNRALNSSLEINDNDYNHRAATQMQAANMNAFFQREAPPRSREQKIMRPVWLGGELLLVRRVDGLGGTKYQGALIDWPALRQSLLYNAADILPGADLKPADRPSGAAEDRLLAGIPAALEAGPPAPLAPDPLSPARLTLYLSWLSAAMAVAAVSALLFGAVSLSERRGAFVSAVTHELRTPLTTFRMYTEMLAGGMVRDEEKKADYLDTLRLEAERLSHLVENVLAYSRLERGRAARIEAVAVDELLGRVERLLRERALMAGMELEVSGPGGCVVLADREAMERILWNLVDNACKYASGGSDRRVSISVGEAPGRALIRVRDRGPGIAPSSAKKVFRAFARAGGEEGPGAPGIGLGLALSRKLARVMGGDLELEQCPKGNTGADTEPPPGAARDSAGSCFVLSLPKAE